MEWSSEGASYAVYGQVTRDSESLAVTGLLPSHQYWFRLRAFNSAGASQYTNTVVVTTLSELSPNGACCVLSNCQLATANSCIALGGQFLGTGTTCTSNPCSQATGACCIQGACQLTTEIACSTIGGQYFGNGSGCLTSPCVPVPPIGACCATNGTCWLLGSNDCADISGQYQGDGTNCTSAPCAPPPPTGACCLSDGSCWVVTVSDCGGMGGSYRGDNTNCAANPCPSPCPPSMPTPMALTGFATSTQAGADWANAGAVQGAPGCTVCACNSTNGPYASNCSSGSAQILTATHFDDFGLPQCAQIVRVVLQVNCRYDNDSDGVNRKFRARLTSPTIGTSWDRDSAAFDTTDGNCRWRDVDFTDVVPAGTWNQTMINSLQAGVRRFPQSGESSNSCFRVIAMRLRIEYVIP